MKVFLTNEDIPEKYRKELEELFGPYWYNSPNAKQWLLVFLLKKIEELENKFNEEICSERREAFHAGYQSNKPNPALECQHRRTEQVKIHQPPFTKIVCLDCGKEL